MSNKGLIVTWLIFAIALFCAFYVITHIFVTRVMADFTVEEPTYSELKVEPNYGTQNNQSYQEQPAADPTNIVVQEVLPTSIQIKGLVKVNEQ